jgi:hypothetical protein
MRLPIPFAASFFATVGYVTISALVSCRATPTDSDTVPIYERLSSSEIGQLLEHPNGRHCLETLRVPRLVGNIKGTRYGHELANCIERGKP